MGNSSKAAAIKLNPDRSVIKQFDHDLERINEELGRTLGSSIPMILNIETHSLMGEGKRIRPLLFILASRLCGYEKEDVYRLSTIFEYLHAASLLHDDVLDNAEIRRKKPSARHVWGNLAAVLGGDYLYSKANALAVEHQDLQLVKILNDASSRMVEGQVLELQNTHNWKLSKEQYMEIITGKTAVLMSATSSSGAIVAGAGEKAFDHLSQFGLNLGTAFQMIDDVLDYTSCEEEFGKPVGKDLKEGKITLPLIYTLSDLDGRERDHLEDLFKNQKAQDSDYMKIFKMVRMNGVIEKIRSEAASYMEKASSYLHRFPESTTRDNLIAINSYLIKRDF